MEQTSRTLDGIFGLGEGYFGVFILGPAGRGVVERCLV